MGQSRASASSARISAASPLVYTFGFEMLAWAATAAAAGKVNAPGALGPVAAFGLHELEAGVRAAGIDRVR